MKKVISGLLVFLCILLFGLFYWLSKQDDNIPPVITFSDETVQYEEDQDTAVLLEGVKAVDEVDGDVSDTLVVESVIPMQDQTTATVLYYAKDKSNNVAKATRIVEYLPADGILWMVETETETEIETETEKATDGIDDDLSPECPRIYLTTDQVTIRQGESYDLLSYVKDITDDEDGPDWLYSQIHIGGMGDINGPGVYELYYSVVDRQNNMSNLAKLTLTIE